jgi:hypothetical protein
MKEGAMAALIRRKAGASSGALVLLLLVTALVPTPTGRAQDARRIFPETGQILQGRFLGYWETHGGLAQYGYPISAEHQEQSAAGGATYTVQYFERAVFEQHPDNTPPYDVMLSLLGAVRYHEKYPQGAANQMPNTTAGSRLFPQTGKRVAGVFLSYWEQHGGLEQQGLPVSDEFQETSDLDGKPYRVQYFERAVFEYHPENAAPYNVLLAQLGTFRYRAKPIPAAGMGTVRSLPDMAVARSCHSATLLRDGTVLLAGGMERDGVFTRSAELYDPATGTFRATGDMVEKRPCHTATLLPDGRVLLAGGWGDTRLASAELYDPATGTFRATGSMSTPRSGPRATLLSNGKVLVTGGSTGDLLTSADLYDPATGQFTPTGSMNAPRSAHTATLLANGKVLITGGGDENNVLASAELYDPATGIFTPTGSMTMVRYKHAAMRLPDGKVLVVGGSDNHDWRGRYMSAELYDPATGTFILTGSMQAARFKLSEAVALLANGRVLVAGGSPLVEIYNPASGTFIPAVGRLDAERFYTTATLLPNGSVLITGGYDPGIHATARAWLYTP